MNRMVMTLARWLGRKPKIGEQDDGTVVYFNEWLDEAWEHPEAKEWRRKERMKLARKAIEAEISKGGKVNSIDPDELRRLIDAYLKDHPEENTLKTIICLEE